MIYQARKRFFGVYPPLVTPLRETRLDEAGLERLIHHVLRAGVHGLFLLGTTGEGPGLDEETKRELVKRACAQTAKRVPMVVAVSDTVVSRTLRLSEAAAKAGADALVVVPPYYLPTGQAEFLAYLDHLLPRLPLPLFVYHMPSMTKVRLERATIQEALSRPGVIGFKDSSGDMGLFHQILHWRGSRDLALFSGSETLLSDAVLFGAEGAVCGGANVHPALFVQTWEAARGGRLAELADLQAQILRLAAIYAHGHHASSGIKGIKTALSVLGICGDEMAAPFEAFHRVEREAVRRDLQEQGLVAP